MKLNYDALQELYDRLMLGSLCSSPYAESPIDRAFKECDEKLSESIAFDYLKKLQDRIEVLERTNKDLRDNNDKLGDKIIELKKDLDAKTKENATLVSANADLSDRNAKLQRNYERIDRLWTGQIQENMELRSKITNMQREKKNYETIAKEREDLLKEKEWVEKQLNHYKSIYYDFEKRIAELQKKGDDLTKKGEDLQQEIEELKKSRKVEVDKGLLNTVLGIKPKEEEHKLDYGDAVRVPWRDYDYMYIGPEGKHIRLFDPKTHTVVVVSVTDNLTYQGCKIILCDEDDIRKIWKDKK